MAFSAPTVMKANIADASNQASLSTGNLTTGASVGDLVVVMVGYGLGSTPTLSMADNSGGGNTWTLAERSDKTTNNTPHSAIFYSILVGALTTSHAITVTPGTNFNFPLIMAYKTTPTASTTVTLDQHTQATGQSTTPSSGNVTTTGTDEILFGMVCTGNGQTLTAGTGWTLLPTQVGNSTKRLDGEYRIESATGTFTANGTITSADWADCIAAFKATAAASTASTRSLRGFG